MRELIPRQCRRLQCRAIGSHIIARETVKALAQERAGEVLRRRRVAQKEIAGKAESGKKRMKQVGTVEYPGGVLSPYFR